MPTVTIRTLPPAPVLTVSQLADRTGLDRKLIPRLVKEGLPAYRLDAKTFTFIEDEATSWLREHGHVVDPYRAAIRRLIDDAPPLTSEQVARIRAVLSRHVPVVGAGPGRGAAGRAGQPLDVRQRPRDLRSRNTGCTGP